MTSKLTLSINKDVIVSAKEYARLSGRSLSDIVESYLALLTADAPSNQVQEVSTELYGIIKLDDDFDEKKEIRRILTDRNKSSK